MRISPLVIASLALVSLAACTPAKQKDDGRTTLIGWVLEKDGTNKEGQEMTHISVYADTINANYQAAITKVFDVETLPGCKRISDEEVHCAQADYVDEFRLNVEASGDAVTFGHRKVLAGESNPTQPFETHYTFNQEDFGTNLDIGLPRKTQEVPK